MQTVEPIVSVSLVVVRTATAEPTKIVKTVRFAHRKNAAPAQTMQTVELVRFVKTAPVRSAVDKVQTVPHHKSVTPPARPAKDASKMPTAKAALSVKATPAEPAPTTNNAMQEAYV